ncbi:hypothetical protein [Corynebacterium sp. CCM 9203]|uniref:hypothetical protein n=1 Tax=Corynebacterium sp. CCM 9203 TaxID=3057615 RepID=UPI0035246DCD
MIDATTATAVHDSVQHIAAGLTNFSPISPDLNGKDQKIGGVIMWGAYLSCAFAMMVAGGMMGWEKYNHGNIESPKKMAAVMIGAMVIASAVTLINWVAS